jgi:hypothetical protein
MISKILDATPAEAVEYALAPQLYPFACVATFFECQIEVSPGSRLTCEDVWAAYQEWWRSKHLARKISEDSFATMALAVCGGKRIAVRVRNNQVVCLDVRLRQAADRGVVYGALL